MFRHRLEMPERVRFSSLWNAWTELFPQKGPFQKGFDWWSGNQLEGDGTSMSGEQVTCLPLGREKWIGYNFKLENGKHILRDGHKTEFSLHSFYYESKRVVKCLLSEERTGFQCAEKVALGRLCSSHSLLQFCIHVDSNCQIFNHFLVLCSKRPLILFQENEYSRRR